jgi:hypothetical protein
MRISKLSLKKSKLLRHRPDRLRAERDGNDRMIRSKIFQVRLKHPKEKIDIVSRLRDFENALVSAVIRKMDCECDLARDEIDCDQAQCELFKKSPEDEEQGLRGLDLVIELKTFIESFRGLNQFERAGSGTVGPFPEPDRLGAEAIPQLLFIKSNQLPKGMNPPLVENPKDFRS